MKKLTSKEVRQMWMDFFESKKHLIVPSKSLIPLNDPSLLWINSGVATLKDYFSGKKIPPSPRLANSQKSIRTNDIENVGVTARHHTLFEMLGNFSIGDYFKKEALEFAVELIFKVFKFKKENIYITYYEKDLDTYNKWLELGIDSSHLIKGDKEMNFWDVGKGPCGPDTEIFYDRGIKYDSKNIGIKLLKEDIENDRYIEIWNIVFSQFNNDGEGNYIDLAQKNIDTGAGLERIVSIFQEAPTNFDTDLFLPIIAEIEKMTNEKYVINNYFINEQKQTSVNKHFKIIADHIRAVSLSIQDGAKPSNTQRGYIIRRLIRRAYRSGLQLGIKKQSFLYKLVNIVSKILDVYPIEVNKVKEIIKNEELAFAKTIKQGEEILFKEITNKGKEFDFSIAFNLFETYGFPIELTQEILEEKGIVLDISRFDEFKHKHSLESRGNKKQKGMDSQIQVIQEITKKVSTFTGYNSLKEETKIIFQSKEQGKYYILLEKTPFYATGGGQDADKGIINDQQVLSVFKDRYGNHWHILANKIEKGKITATVSKKIRANKENNHSATHLLGFALRKVFGNQVVQLGSDNNENRLRFDFPLDQRPKKEQLLEVENLINDLIVSGDKREYIETSFDNGKKIGAIALEGEDYGSKVRVVSFGDSIEFCGGTHVKNTADIETFKITKFESKGSGVFRIEAITSKKMVDKFNANELLLAKQELNALILKNKKLDNLYKLNVKPRETIEFVNEAIKKAKVDNKNLSKQIKNTKIDMNIFTPKTIDGIEIIEHNASPGEIKHLAISLREKFTDALIIIKAPKASLVAIASIKYDSLKEAKKMFPNLKGGGNKRFVMGKIL